MKQYFKPWRKFINENISQIPDNILERYREGNCLLFAETLLKLLNNPDSSLSSVVVSTDGYNWTIAHVIVSYQYEKYLDIDGIQSEQQLKNKIVNYYLEQGFQREDIEVEIKDYNPSEWEDFYYDPSNTDDDSEQPENTKQTITLDLNKDGTGDSQQTASPGKMYPESPAETLKWAKIVLNNASIVKNA